MTQKELKALLNYDPSTGLFTWATGRVGAAKDSVAGSLNNGYIRIMINRKGYKAHNLACLYMTGSFPKHIIDHEDHDPGNNIWSNLIEKTGHENNKNKSKSRNNTSGVTGVTWVKKTNRWSAYIYVNKKRIHLIETADKDLAIAKRYEAEIKYGFHKNHGR